jgi:hypothetical protein
MLIIINVGIDARGWRRMMSGGEGRRIKENKCNDTLLHLLIMSVIIIIKSKCNNNY